MIEIIKAVCVGSHELAREFNVGKEKHPIHAWMFDASRTGTSTAAPNLIVLVPSGTEALVNSDLPVFLNSVTEEALLQAGNESSLPRDYQRELLVVLLVEEEKNILSNKDISDVEENLHLAQKYVLSWNAAAHKLLRVAVTPFTAPTLAAFVSNREKFMEFKINPDRAAAYALAARLMIKLPFVHSAFSTGLWKDSLSYVAEDLGDNKNYFSALRSILVDESETISEIDDKRLDELLGGVA